MQDRTSFETSINGQVEFLFLKKWNVLVLHLITLVCYLFLNKGICEGRRVG